jgi:hypothetical protein
MEVNDNVWVDVNAGNPEIPLNETRTCPTTRLLTEDDEILTSSNEIVRFQSEGEHKTVPDKAAEKRSSNFQVLRKYLNEKGHIATGPFVKFVKTRCVCNIRCIYD